MRWNKVLISCVAYRHALPRLLTSVWLSRSLLGYRLGHVRQRRDVHNIPDILVPPMCTEGCWHWPFQRLFVWIISIIDCPEVPFSPAQKAMSRLRSGAFLTMGSSQCRARPKGS